MSTCHFNIAYFSHSRWSRSPPLLRLIRFHAKPAISRRIYAQYFVAAAAGEPAGQGLRSVGGSRAWYRVGGASSHKSSPGQAIMNGTNHAEGAQPDGLVDYEFPKSKLKNPQDVSKQPVALIACGSFSPVFCEPRTPELLG